MQNIINNRYRIIEKIKEKPKATVYRAFDLKDQIEVAIKVLNLQKNTEADIKKINTCLNTMNKIDSKYSLKYYETFNTSSEMYIIYEYCNDNLKEKMKTFKNKQKIFYIKKIFNQLMELYKILHQNNIIIRELKPEKILIKYTNLEETEFDIKITDYSFSKELSDNEITKTIIGYSIYVAPEISRGEKYTNKCDLWSIGILGYILYFDKLPVFKGVYSFEEKIIVPEDEYFQDFLKKLLVAAPKERISWDEFFNHDFFKEKKNFDDITKKDFDEFLKQYPKKEDLNGVEIEEANYQDSDSNYYGEVIKGTQVLCGRAIFVKKKEGILLKGYFSNNLLHGRGEIRYADGFYCEGNFLNGLQFGKGREIYPNGNEYTGDFKNNIYDGEGELKYNNGNIYNGQFVNGKMKGEGKFFYKKNNQTYEGGWLNNEKHGKGTIYYADGRKLVGTWKNGFREGEFKYYRNKDDTKELKIEIFQNGKIKNN